MDVVNRVAELVGYAVVRGSAVATLPPAPGISPVNQSNALR
jgi:hypothetical protein